ncbi:aldo/keto reductase [Parerythrobacter aestuarii]|uniref:aldo/keto reductase n=1 Tax=Parerythrobacter aestuarii TaxID=3020909 RepID=UPI0024DEED47|nr:aldo/keto reductase [Parerythrobacter aestuarii]
MNKENNYTRPCCPIALGTMALVSTYNERQDTSAAKAVIEEAFDSGIRLFHCAGHYGNGYAFSLLRQTLTGDARAHSQVCVKIEGQNDRLLNGPEGIDSSLTALDREVIDFAQVVESREDVPNQVSMTEVLEQLKPGKRLRHRLEEARRAGKIRKLGAEIQSAAHLALALQCDLDFVVGDQSLIRQTVPVDPVPREIESGEVDFIAIRPLAGGWLTDRYRNLQDFAAGDHRREWYAAGESARERVAEVCEDYGLDIYSAAMRFLLGNPVARFVVVGTRTPDQLRAAMQPTLNDPLPPEVAQAFLSLFDQPFDLEPPE